MPKAVLTHFSPYLEDCLPPTDKQNVNRKGCDGATYVTIYGGVKAAYILICQWMLASCKNQSIQRIERLGFAQYARLHEAATLLDIPRIKNDMVNRMDKMSKSQIPVQDVRVIYANFPKDSLPRQIVIRSIGDAVFERRLRRWDLYKEFKLECVEYDNDIYDYTEQRRQAIQDAELANKKGQKARRRKSGEHTKGSNDKVEEPTQVVTKTVKGVVARKGRGAQPTYVRIGLNDFGVSNQHYAGNVRRT
ncbi:predicted protein [Uncinocarpus reesii 1704]|uniref:Uncharacterized protein n=1 Tax=Uncinocarpus reesii (strain UAMH 1704) TaxID=336963 RepID=C4JZA8_UNCRE|nr:uncharacterized protein UREG_07509 [Uncinocarpus reesii 1704]EEP82644.1 predicted protein [Uncinocarpus reesii 1704]